MHTAIVWFRNDLRLTDNPALSEALASAQTVLPVYIHAPDEAGIGSLGSASRWWLHHSLLELSASLAKRGAELVIMQGDSLSSLRALAATSKAAAIYWNRTYEPTLVKRDTLLKHELRQQGLLVKSFPGNLLIEPWDIQTKNGGPFKVFTPFWRACQALLAAVPTPLPAPKKITSARHDFHSLSIPELKLIPTIPWAEGFAKRFVPGEAAALQRLSDFLDAPVTDYAQMRDRPDHDGTSRLSPHLHFGEISPRQALSAAAARALDPDFAGRARGTDSFLREIGWREFAQHVLYHFPHTSTEPLDPRFKDHAWRSDPTALLAWQRGLTGIPLVDAGMRELWHTGWMHNRVRMIVASFLTKNLGVHWLEGAAWFLDTLVDADLASNTLGWQWTAGCGADAAPYYRIFSPVLQSERFDPERVYLRRWLPELAALPDAWIHKPHEAPAEILTAARVRLGRDYPLPIVDMKSSRARALTTWQEARETSVDLKTPETQKKRRLKSD